MRSVEEVYIEDRPTDRRPATDRRPTNERPHIWRIQMAISLRQIIRFTPYLVLGWGFRGWRIEWRCFRFVKIQQVCGKKTMRDE